MIESKFISRAATFTFFLGDHFFGVITAYVEGGNAGLYHFTSSLPVQIVKFLKPILSPLINNTPSKIEPAKPIAQVVVAETVKPVINASDPVKPVAEVAAVKKLKPAAEIAAAKIVKPTATEAVVKITKPPVKEAVAKVAKPAVKEAPVPVKPLVKEMPTQVVKPLIKETPAQVVKPLVKETPAQVAKPLAENTKPSTDQKTATTDRTRYYKYPTPPNPAQ